MKLPTRITRVYDDALKRKVVEEYLTRKTSYSELCRKYKICSHGAIADWTRKLGYSLHTRKKAASKKIRFVVEPIAIAMSGPEKSKLDLEKENRELKRKLEDANLRAEAYFRIIEKAEQELKIKLKKKLNSR